MCEWKGAATYHNLTLNSDSTTVSRKIWSYASPTPRFKGIKDYLCFYANGVPWSCYVDGEKVQPQEGDFYGGWVRHPINMICTRAVSLNHDLTNCRLPVSSKVL